jgi:hypothetical protein
LQQVVGYPGHTGRDAKILAEAARDPTRRSYWLLRGYLIRAFVSLAVTPLLIEAALFLSASTLQCRYH